MTQKLGKEFPEMDFAPKEVTGRIVRLASVLQGRFEVILKTYDINLQIFSVLAAIRASGSPFEISPKEILATAFLTSGGLSNILKRLERKALITRLSDPHDRRGVLVKLTPKGIELIEDALISQVRAENELISTLSLDEQASLKILLNKLLKDVDPVFVEGN